MAVYHFLQTSSAWLSDFASKKDKMYAAKLGRPWPASQAGDKGRGHVAEKEQESGEEKGRRERTLTREEERKGGGDRYM